MVDWSAYEELLTIKGKTSRERQINSFKEAWLRDAPDNPSFKLVDIDGKKSGLILKETNNSQIIKFSTLDSVSPSSVVEYAENYWLITKVYVDKDTYIKGEMEMCPMYINLYSPTDNIISKYWVSIKVITEGEDTGKYLTIGDSEYTIQIKKDNLTEGLKYGQRVLIPFGRSAKAYKIVAIDSFSSAVNNIILLGLKEDVLGSSDNLDLMIANYPYPEESTLEPELPDEPLDYVIDSEDMQSIRVGIEKKFTTNIEDPLWSVFFDKNIHTNDFIVDNLDSSCGVTLSLSLASSLPLKMTISVQSESQQEISVTRQLSVVGIFG